MATTTPPTTTPVEEMTRTYIILDLDSKFNGLNFEPVILNDLEMETLEDREALNNLIITTYDNVDKLSPVPSCTCHRLQFGYNLGQICDYCGTRVESPTETSIESSVWFRAPEGIDGFLNPTVYLILRQAFTFGRFSVLDWLLSPGYDRPPPRNRPAVANVNRLIEAGVPRGLNNFIAHFDRIFDMLTSMVPRNRRRDLCEFARQWKHNFFPKYLPMPSKIAFVIEKTSIGNYADLTMREAIDAARNMAALNADDLRSITRLENKIVNITRLIGDYNDYMLTKPLSPKEGWYRRYVFSGGRSTFAHRSVIVSMPGVHDYETFTIPFAQACTVFRIHLQNLLKQHHAMSARESAQFIDSHCNQRQSEGGQLLESLLKDILANTQGGDGVWSKWIRYPVLEMASIQTLRIVGFEDNVSTLSPLDTKGMNADKLNC